MEKEGLRLPGEDAYVSQAEDIFPVRQLNGFKIFDAYHLNAYVPLDTLHDRTLHPTLRFVGNARASPQSAMSPAGEEEPHSSRTLLSSPIHAYEVVCEAHSEVSVRIVVILKY
jgi:hypothetical protein